MSSIVAWVSMLCFASVACTVMRMLAPEGSLGRVFKTVTVAFFICAFCIPILSAKNLLNFEAVNINVNSSEQNAAELQEEIDLQFNNQVNNTITLVCNEVLSEYKVVVIKVEVEMNTEEKSGVNIDNIIVYLDKESQPKTIEVTKRLEETFGVKITVRTADSKS